MVSQEANYCNVVQCNQSKLGKGLRRSRSGDQDRGGFPARGAV